ncbi:MAG TPA: hypothetical protein VN026_13500 [Bacteroidia bacterium]|jgi:hypothetical protein|nr:hypothetical protein [Bacteroidia bacterium]
MKKLKWSYDKRRNQWYTLETVSWANDGFTINKEGLKKFNSFYRLEKGSRYISNFSKLKNAKKVAELIYNG